MSARAVSLPLAVALVAIAAAGAWQYFDMTAHQRAHVEEERRHANALLEAADGVALRECRGGRFVAAELQGALEDLLARFALEWLAIRTQDGRTIAAAGRPPRADEAPFVHTRAFEPRSPQPLGRGPRWADGAATSAFPDAPLALTLAMPRATLEDQLDDDRMRALVTTTALAAAILLLVGASWQRARSFELRAALVASEAQREGLETLRRLGAGLAHETRNPLGVVRGFAEQIARGRVEAQDLQRTARAIVEETDRTVARLDEFLLLSRPATLRRTKLALKRLCDELAVLLQPDAESLSARLTVAVADLSIDADPDQLRRLLLNLVLNALQAVEPGGHVEIGTERRDATLAIVVADDGRGVPEELRDTLFEPYVSGRAGGTGLGLAIARRIAIDHGFALRHEPRSPRGTRMILEIPAP